MSEKFLAMQNPRLRVPNVNSQVRLPKVKNESFCISSVSVAFALKRAKMEHAAANCYLQDPDGNLEYHNEFNYDSI